MNGEYLFENQSICPGPYPEKPLDTPPGRCGRTCKDPSCPASPPSHYMDESPFAKLVRLRLASSRGEPTVVNLFASASGGNIVQPNGIPKPPVQNYADFWGRFWAHVNAQAVMMPPFGGEDTPDNILLALVCLAGGLQRTAEDLDLIARVPAPQPNPGS